MKSYTRITFSAESDGTFQNFISQLRGFHVMVKPRGGAPSFRAEIKEACPESETGDEVLLQLLDNGERVGDPLRMRVQSLHVL